MTSGTLILEHCCLKWRKGMRKPKFEPAGKHGSICCSCCGEKVKGRVDFK